MDIREVKVKKILNPTAIDLGEYVINPYRGCEFSCLYCYVRFNKVSKNDIRPWGKYVDVRINAPQLLEKELSARKPHRVLLGSTTECFQPLEVKYGVTQEILKILNDYKIYYNILTRSPLILDYIPLLKGGFCEGIYFTINRYDARLKSLLEPKSASFHLRMEAVDRLLEEDLPVTAYFSPVLPCISDIKDIFIRFEKTKEIEFEGLNFNLGNREAVLEAIGTTYPHLKELYKQMASSESVYNSVWQSVKKEITKQAIKAKKNYHIYTHRLNAYFENKYLNK